MANLIKPGEVKIVSKNNEILVNIALELNIKLDGSITNLNLGTSDSPVSSLQKKEDDKVAWAIPDFAPSNKIKFGKEKEE
jgi:hypothetical protein